MHPQLGTLVSTNLNFSTHLNRTSSNATKSLGFIKRKLKTKHTGVREAAYNTTVRPKPEYASPVWSPYTQTYSHKIEMVRQRPIPGPLTANHMTVSVKCRRTLIGGRLTKGGRNLDFACYVRLCMALLPFNFHHISNSQVE